MLSLGPRHGRVPIQLPIFIAMAITAWLCIWRWQVDSYGDPLHLYVSGTVEGEVADAGSRIGGRVSKVMVQEGDRVEAGEVLAFLETSELSSQRDQLLAVLRQSEAQTQKLVNGPRHVDLAQAAAGVEVARAQLAELEAGTRSEDIAASKAAWDAADAIAKQALADLQRSEQLYSAGVIPMSQVEQARTNSARLNQSAEAARQAYEKALAGPRSTQIDAGKAQLKAAQALYSQLAAGAREEDVVAAKASVDGVRAQIDALDKRIDEATVNASNSGAVLSVNHQAGDLVGPNQSVVSLLLDGSLFIQVFIPEDKLSWAQPGAIAQVQVDSFPGETFEGVVTYLAALGEFTPRNLQTKDKRVEQVFRCKVKLDHEKLRPGMACDVVFTKPGGG